MNANLATQTRIVKPHCQKTSAGKLTLSEKKLKRLIKSAVEKEAAKRLNKPKILSYKRVSSSCMV